MYLRWWCAFLFPLFANCAKKVITSFGFLCVVCRYILYSIPASLHDVFCACADIAKRTFLCLKKSKGNLYEEGKKKDAPWWI